MLNRTIGKRITDQATKALLQAVAHASPGSVAQVLNLAERVAPAGLPREQLRAIRRLWEEGAPSAQLVRRVLQQANPDARMRLVTNFVINNAWGQGKKRRDEFSAQHGFYPPFTILISPTMRCNLRCAGCYAGEYTADDDLPLAVIHRVLGEAKELGIHFVTILGGEPFVRADMWDVYAQHDDVYFQVYTNGTPLTEQNVARLAHLGNVAVAVSIEGWEAETDGRRGPGTYQAVMAAFDRLRRAGIPFGFSSMITRHNVETLCSDEFYAMLIDRGCLFGWHFMYMPVGSEPDLSLMPTPEQREYLRTHGAARIRATYPLFVVDFWNDAPYVGGCIAAKDYLHINSKGDVEPCIFTHFAVDNVKEKSLSDCLDSPFFRAIRARQPYDADLLLPCMLIDHPHVFREVHAACRPQGTHRGADRLVGDMAAGLDAYSQRIKAIMDVSWQAAFDGKRPGPPAGNGDPENTLARAA